MLTVHGIETQIILQCLKYLTLVATVLTVHGIETHDDILSAVCLINKLQQCLPFTVCAEGCETAEAQSDDEAHTLQVPE